MKRLALAAAIALAANAAGAADTVDATAREALAACAAHADATRYEYGGAVIATADGYRYSVPVRGGKAEVTYTLKLARGERIAALYHSHTGHQTLDEYFSAADIANADRMSVPSYIIVPGRANAVRLYMPHAPTSYVAGHLAALGSILPPL